MTKEKKVMLGALAAIGGILLYARAKKKRELLNSGVDDLKKSFIAIVDGADGDLISDGDLEKVNLPSQNLTEKELLRRYGIEV